VSHVFFKYRKNKFGMSKLSGLVKGLGKELPITSQILIDVRYKRKGGSWTDKIQMILDTGAVISMLPRAWYYELEVSESVEYKLYGVNRKEECSLDTRVAEVTLVLEDEENRSEEFNTFVAFYEDAPLLLGMMTLLKFDIEINNDFAILAGE
jgi:hypothetical protein